MDELKIVMAEHVRPHKANAKITISIYAVAVQTDPDKDAGWLMPSSTEIHKKYEHLHGS